MLAARRGFITDGKSCRCGRIDWWQGWLARNSLMVDTPKRDGMIISRGEWSLQPVVVRKTGTLARAPVDLADENI